MDFRCVAKKNVTKPKCQFGAIYMEENGCLYARGQHEHDKVQKFGKKNKEKTVEHIQEYRDRDGKLWPFHARIGKNISLDIFHKKFGFTKIQTRNPTLNFYCLKKGSGPNGKCPFSGIYVKANGCLYIRGKHEHTGRNKAAPQIGDDYVDQIWQIVEIQSWAKMFSAKYFERNLASQKFKKYKQRYICIVVEIMDPMEGNANLLEFI